MKLQIKFLQAIKKNIVFVVFLLLALSYSYADLYSPDRQLYTIATEHFTFIFPADSRPAAEYLASFAEEAYADIANKLGTTVRHHIPVVITPDSELMNGYYKWIPYMQITLYETAIDINSSLGSYNDNLKKLFYHELTHAVSLTIRSSFENFLVTVFGSPFGVSSYLTPANFVEGVTVSFESLDGFGRAADPLSASILRQDILENKWKTFDQSAGAYDLYPYGNLFYIYGGYFSSYLQKRFGMETYAKIWKEFGILSLFTPLDKGLFSDGRFAKVFGITLSEAWLDFMKSMRMTMPVYMADQKLRKLSIVSPLAAKDGFLYYADAFQQKMYMYDTSKNNELALFTIRAQYVSNIDISNDGKKLLISTNQAIASNSLPRLVVQEYDLNSKKLTDTNLSKIYGASYFANTDSIIGIQIDGYVSNLIINDGKTTIQLLKGNETISYANPVSDKDGIIYAIIKEQGKTSIIKLQIDPTDKKVLSIQKLVLPDNITWLRYLSIDENNTLRFSWDDNALYRLAELNNDILSYQNVPISGGVHGAVYTATNIYYVGNFSEGMAPCLFPQDRTQLGFTEQPVSWIDASYLLETQSVYDKPSTHEEKKYNAAFWLLPRFWYPTLSISTQNDKFNFESLGLATLLSDPAERLLASLSAAWNFQANAVDAKLKLNWTRFETPINFEISDVFELNKNMVNRLSKIQAGFSYTYLPVREGKLNLELASAIFAGSQTPAGKSGYVKWAYSSIPIELSISWKSITAPINDDEAITGYLIESKTRFDNIIYPKVYDPTVGVELGLHGFVGFAAIKFSLYGAASALPGLAYNAGGRAYTAAQITQNALYPKWNEFLDSASGPWYSQAEISFRLFSLEIQKSLGALYINRLWMRTGARGYIASGPNWNSGYANYGFSFFARLGITISPVIGALARVHLPMYIEVWMRPDKNQNKIFKHGFAFNIQIPFDL